MNFFKSVLFDEPDSPSHGSNQPHPEHTDNETEAETADATTSYDGAWSFGGLIQTLASKSESVIENYRRDLEEFSSGLRKETVVIREAASRAVKDLPASLDVGATVAQESLETVGQAIDDIGSSVWKSTAHIISHGRESLLSPDFDSSNSFDSGNYDSNNRRLSSSGSVGQDLKRYSRFDALVRALQSDVNTYLEDPEDLQNYGEWKLGFELGEKSEEIGNLMEENGVVEEIYGKVVPSRTDHESFWRRYFYKLHKLNQAEEARVKLVKRAISGDEEEDLSWDFDDDDEEGYELKGGSSRVAAEQPEMRPEQGTSAEVVVDDDAIEEVSIGEKDLKAEDDGKGIALESKTDGGNKSGEVEHDGNASPNVVSNVSDGGDDKLDAKSEEKDASEVKTDNENGGSCKDSDISVISSQPSMAEEEDMGWDEIEDINSNDENKGDVVGSTSRFDLRKRLSAADQEEDLSWDIEEDEDVKP